MASTIDICNLALSHLGDPANVASIDPPEGSPQARYCARYYPVARDEILESHAWSFNTRRAPLVSASVALAASEWGYAYILPSNNLRTLAVYSPSITDAGQTEDFAVEAIDGDIQIVYTNTFNAYIRYLVRVTDTSRYPPSFVVALSYLLARYLAGPMTKDPGIVESMDKLYAMRSARAQALDSNAQSTDKWREERAPIWLTGR